ncbi:hypothetical protein [Paraburkholderia sp.]|uniref:hypothetical protein n=1 Tax=Paraburkholderia sp. TaxID=1926495 RepID=UPI0025F7ADDC|nr:hypothetical protein [Paraburkholderia sp.]
MKDYWRSSCYCGELHVMEEQRERHDVARHISHDEWTNRALFVDGGLMSVI